MGDGGGVRGRCGFEARVYGVRDPSEEMEPVLIPTQSLLASSRRSAAKIGWRGRGMWRSATRAAVAS